MPAPTSYTGYDFDSLVTQMQTYLKSKGTWKDLYRSSTGQTLIEVFAYVVTFLIFYLERRVEEVYLPTAKLYSSVVSLVGLLGYVPRRKTSARGYVTFTLTVAHAHNIYIPKFTRIKTAGDIEFLTTEDAVILAGALSTDVAVIQGEKTEFTVVADGRASAKIKISDTDVEDEALWIYVNGAEWTLVESFIRYTSTALIYEIRNELDGTISVMFGDGQFGLIPPSGQTILVQYIKSAGLAGIVYSASIVNILVDTISDDEGTVVTDISVSNASPILGGADAESLEEIRDNAPRIFRTGDRAVTKADYAAIISAYPSVASAKVWGEYEEGAPDFTNYNVVKLCMLLQNWAIPDSAFEQIMATYLQDFKVITTRNVFIDPVIIEVVPYIEAKVLTSYGLVAVQDAISTALEDMFELVWDTLGKSARYSDFVRLIDETAGVDYHHSYMRLRELAVLVGGSNYTLTAGLAPISPNSVLIYDGTVLVAQDDGLSGFVEVASGYSIAGSVDYTTGEMSFSLSPATDVISVIYQQNQQGDLIVQQYQALKYNPDYSAIIVTR